MDDNIPMARALVDARALADAINQRAEPLRDDVAHLERRIGELTTFNVKLRNKNDDLHTRLLDLTDAAAACQCGQATLLNTVHTNEDGKVCWDHPTTHHIAPPAPVLPDDQELRTAVLERVVPVLSRGVSVLDGRDLAIVANWAETGEVPE